MIYPPSQGLTILIKPENKAFLALAQDIAFKLKGVLVGENNVAKLDNNSVTILIAEQGISLKRSGDTKEHPVFIDFSHKKIWYRQKNSGTRKEALARAVGLKSNQPITILDATAGLGGDSFILAGLGANMLMLERNPLVHLLLEDALRRGRDDIKLREIISRMELLNADTITFLDKIDITPDVIYMDPMFPEKTKSALNKKEMRMFREIVGADEDIDVLLKKSLSCAKKRVVIKRPSRAPHVNNIKPHFYIPGKSSRFDIYMVEN